MQERLMAMGTSAARVTLVVAAFLVAIGSIGLTIVRPFCPEVVPSASTAVVSDDPSVAPSDATTADPADAAGAAEPDDGATEGESPSGPCAGGQDRCLPPMIEGILQAGRDVCHDQAASRMRGTLLPALVVSVGMLVGAWALRPRAGGSVFSRW